MEKYGMYLVCKDKIKEVGEFLERFYNKIENHYTHDEWLIFKAPNSDFLINLMVGDDQEVSKNITFEIYCVSLEELTHYSEEFDVEIQSFLAIKSSAQYKYHYIEILGPAGICKIELSFSENI